MDIEYLTIEDIHKYEEDIKRFLFLRKVFLAIGLACIGLGILFFIITILVAANEDDAATRVFAYISASMFTGALVFLVLLGVLFNRRIQTRRILIEQARQYQNKNDEENSKQSCFDFK